MINQCPLNDLSHDHLDVILTPRLAVINISELHYFFIIPYLQHSKVKSCYYDDKKSSNLKLMEINDWEITVSKTNDQKTVINGQPLFSLRNNGPKNSGC